MPDVPSPHPSLHADAFEGKAAWHRAAARLPLTEKFRVLLALQHQDLPLLAAHRKLAPWERPWNIRP